MKEIALGWFFKKKGGWKTCSLLSFHVDASENVPTKAFPNVMIPVTPFTSVCDLQSIFYCMVLFSLHNNPMKRDIIRTSCMGWELPRELLFRLPKLVGGRARM